MRFGASLEGTWVRSNFQGYARRAKPSPLLSACSHTAVLVPCAVATLGGWHGGRIFDDMVPLSRVAFGRCVAVGAQRNLLTYAAPRAREQRIYLHKRLRRKAQGACM